jgi:hypothetical protein
LAFVWCLLQVLGNPVLGPISRALVQRVLGQGISEEEAVFPITKIPGTSVPSLIPVSNLERVYFKFGSPISTSDLDDQDKERCFEQYAACKASVEQLIRDLLEFRESDPDRKGGQRTQRQLMRTVRASLGSLSL